MLNNCQQTQFHRNETLENENGHGKVMEHELIGQKSWNVVIQSWNFTNVTPNLY